MILKPKLWKIYWLTFCDHGSFGKVKIENLTFREYKFQYNQTSAVIWPIRSLESIIYSVIQVIYIERSDWPNDGSGLLLLKPELVFAKGYVFNFYISEGTVVAKCKSLFFTVSVFFFLYHNSRSTRGKFELGLGYSIFKLLRSQIFGFVILSTKIIAKSMPCRCSARAAPPLPLVCTFSTHRNAQSSD